MNVLLDENLSPRLVQLLAAKGIAAQHVAHVGLSGASDPEVWRYAYEHDQVVVTINATDSSYSPVRSISTPGSSCSGRVGWAARSSGSGSSRSSMPSFACGKVS